MNEQPKEHAKSRQGKRVIPKKVSFNYGEGKCLARARRKNLEGSAKKVAHGETQRRFYLHKSNFMEND